MIFARTTPTDDAGARCPGCGNAMEPDQLACLECGAVPAAGGRGDRRWLLPAGGVAGVALFLVTSASFAATTAMQTGDPHAMKPPAPALAQAAPATPPPATAGIQAAPHSSKKSSGGSGSGDTPPPPAAAPAPAAPSGGAAASGGSPAAPSGGSSGSSGGSSSGSSGGSGSGGSSSGSGSGGSGSSSGSNGSGTTSTTPPVKLTQWNDSPSGSYTVIVYKFNDEKSAKAKAKEVAAKGLPAGVLHSDDYESLDPGSYLVFIGQFDSAKQADKAQAKYDRAGYPGEVTFVGHQQSPDYQPPDTTSASTTPSQSQP
ncbi:MAG: hypothetical protein QOJ07_3689 [Thermoleophilaceae bacterium]|nr:hypothetical protein [Thermoleophilaceae bacterium]